MSRIFGKYSQVQSIQGLSKAPISHFECLELYNECTWQLYMTVCVQYCCVAVESRLDILVNNAGVLSRKRLETEDGFELHFAVNHLGTFVYISRSGGPLVITVANGLQEFLLMGSGAVSARVGDLYARVGISVKIGLAQTFTWTE